MTRIRDPGLMLEMLIGIFIRGFGLFCFFQSIKPQERSPTARVVLIILAVPCLVLGGFITYMLVFDPHFLPGS